MLSNKYNDPQQPTNKGEKSKSQQVLIIAGILMGLLVLLNVVIYLRGDSKLKEANTMNEKQTEAMTALQQEIAAANARFDSLATLFPAKEEQIEELKRQLEEKERELQKYIASGGNLSAARNEIASLREANQSLQSQLEVERNKNISSQARIDELTRELQNISDELVQTRQRLQSYEEKASQTATSNPEPSSNTSGNESGTTPTPNPDKALSISSVSVKANEISKKDPKKKRETKYASKTGEFQICIVVEATEGVGPSDQEFHIQIIDPSQTTIGNATAPDRSTGTAYKYTLSEPLKYDGANAQVCAYYKSSDFKQGTYEVNVWNKGYKVGSGSVSLKK